MEIINLEIYGKNKIRNIVKYYDQLSRKNNGFELISIYLKQRIPKKFLS